MPFYRVAGISEEVTLEETKMEWGYKACEYLGMFREMGEQGKGHVLGTSLAILKEP